MLLKKVCIISHIAKMKYILEKTSSNSFYEDFDVEVLSKTQDVENNDYYKDIITDIYNLEITFKPTGKSFRMTYPLLRLDHTNDEETNFKNNIIEYIHQTTQMFVKGDWCCMKDSYETWYYSNKLKLGDISDVKYNSWAQLTNDLQSIMMNRFETFIDTYMK